MDSILSTVLSIFSHNPIIVLGIIAYVAFSIIRGKNSEESDEYESYESSSSGMTWEDMEREYGISIERKVEESSAQDLLYDNSAPSEKHVEEHPNDDTSKTVLTVNHHYDEAVTTKQGGDTSSKSASSKSTSFSTTRLDREAVTEAPLNERLAEFKRDKASKEGRVLVETVGVTTAPAVTSTRSRKSNHALKEGMKWSIILGKPKALERRYR